MGQLNLRYLLMTIATLCFLVTAGKAAEDINSTDPYDPLKGHRVVCLFNNIYHEMTKFSPRHIEAEHCTHLNYEFAILDPKAYQLVPGQPSLDIEKGFYKEAVDLKKVNPRLKVLLSMGGWMDSTDKYSQLVENDSRIDNFIENVIPFLKEHGFDGLDVAWEFPNCWQGALGIKPADKANFGHFLQKVRDAFDEESLLLTISASAIKREILAGYDGPVISKAVHFVNVMTYDMHGPWESTTGHHSQLENTATDSDPYMNMKSALLEWAKLGVDRMKLIAGIPTYAKTYTLQNSNDHTFGSPTIGSGKPGFRTKTVGFMCYHELCELINNSTWTEGQVKNVGYYAFFGDQWASYDPPPMVVAKVKWVMENGFSGVLLKDAACDDTSGTCYGATTNPLLKMAKMEIEHKLKPKHEH